MRYLAALVVIKLQRKTQEMSQTFLSFPFVARVHFLVLVEKYLAKLTKVNKVVSSSCVMMRGPSIRIRGILKTEKQKCSH